MALPLLNSSILTTDGVYQRRTVSLFEARDLLAAHDRQVDSAIGHQGTARILSTLLGVDVPVNRKKFTQKVGQIALVLQLKGLRLPSEGSDLLMEEILGVGYDLKTLTRMS